MENMKTKIREKQFKIVPIQKRFQMDYEFVYGGEKIKSYLNKIGVKRGKYQIFDDPSFDIE
jgi:hypothetical protein